MSAPWLDVEKAAKYAGLSVTKIRRAIRDGGLRAYRIEGGRLWRLRVEDVDRWIEGADQERAS